jgi:GTP-binding protein YchF
MKLGIIGLPQSGKTTIFNALTRGYAPTTASAGRIEVHTAVIDVPDTRLDELGRMFAPREVIQAKITYADIAGLDGSAGKTGISGTLLNQLAQMDGFILVLRCFQDENIMHPAGSIDPSRDLAAMESELLLNDLIAVERKMERLKEERLKGAVEKALIERQASLFEKLHKCLSEEKPLREIEFSPEEEKTLSGFGLLTRKAMLILLNLSEGQTPPDIDRPKGSPVISLQGKLEMEIAQLPPDEAQLFMNEYRIKELGLEKMIRLSYDLLDLQSFFTIGDKEVRAWTVRRGATAQQAAGEVHTDMQRGFIRAEVISYDELAALGSLAEARTKGKLRLEGKEYIIQDGEIVYIRFNV